MQRSFREAAVAVLIALVAAEPSPEERKARIMVMREVGLLTDAETADLIRIYGLEAA